MSKVTAEDLMLWRVEARIRELAVGGFATLASAVEMYREAQSLPGAVPHPVMERLLGVVDAHAAALRGMVDVPPVPPAVAKEELSVNALELQLHRTSGAAASGFSRQQLEVVAEEHSVEGWSTLSHGALVEAVATVFSAPQVSALVPVVAKTFKLKKR